MIWKLQNWRNSGVLLCLQIQECLYMRGIDLYQDFQSSFSQAIDSSCHSVMTFLSQTARRALDSIFRFQYPLVRWLTRQQCLRWVVLPSAWLFCTVSSQSRLELHKSIREFSRGPALVMDRDLKVTDSLNALHLFHQHWHLKMAWQNLVPDAADNRQQRTSH